MGRAWKPASWMASSTAWTSGGTPAAQRTEACFSASETWALATPGTRWIASVTRWAQPLQVMPTTDNSVRAAGVPNAVVCWSAGMDLLLDLLKISSRITAVLRLSWATKHQNELLPNPNCRVVAGRCLSGDQQPGRGSGHESES